MTVALLVSLFLAMTWTPTLSQYLLKDRQGNKEGGEKSPEKTGGEENVDPAMLLAAEEAHLSGFFGRIVNFYALSFLEWMLLHRWHESTLDRRD